MPFLTGSLSVRRYLVLDQIPNELEQTATLAMRRYSFKPIDDARGEKESFGWVNPRRVLQDSFTYEDVLISPYVYLGVRRDRKNFSQVLFKARREERYGQIKSEKNIQKLSKQHRLAIDEELTIEMLKETSPQSAFNEIVWDTNSNIVYMGATSNSLCERIQELFEATFDLKIRQLFPALIGADYITSQGLEDEYHLAGAMVDQASVEDEEEGN